MEIPYTVDVRPDTGLSNGKLGVWLFLASEVMLFAALFSSYILLRVGSVEWPHGYEELSVPMAFFNTVVLITSSVTMVMAWASLKMNDFGKFRVYLGLTILLSFVFLVVKYFEYSHKYHEGLLPGAYFSYHGHGSEVPNQFIFFSFYFMMTGLHGIHILLGMVVIGWVLRRAIRGDFDSTYYTPVDLVALYWHLVDLIWIYLFPLLYLIS